MDVLIIDNNTIHLKEVENLLANYKTKIVKFTDLKKENINNYGLIILSGSSQSAVLDTLDECAYEIDIIKNSHLPIVGICFGCELIAYIYGSKLERRSEKLHGIMEIKHIGNPIFKDLSVIEVYEGHRWVIKEISSELESLAISEYGHEIIKHKNKPIYGLQFHPEMFIDKTQGDEIFKNILKEING